MGCFAPWVLQPVGRGRLPAKRVLWVWGGCEAGIFWCGLWGELPTYHCGGKLAARMQQVGGGFTLVDQRSTLTSI